MYNTHIRRYTHGNIYQKSHNADFLHILKNKPLDRITVKDICEQCEINRNTFYYYFKDIYDVLEAIFEDEVRLVMDEAKEGVTFHDAYARVAALILNNREAIMHIYASENGRVLRTYLDAVVTQVVRRFVLKRQRATAWMIVTLLLSRRFTATESWAVQLSGLREAV